MLSVVDDWHSSKIDLFDLICSDDQGESLFLISYIGVTRLPLSPDLFIENVHEIPSSALAGTGGHEYW